MGTWLRKWAGNLSLLVVGGLATLLLLDLVFFPRLMTRVPLKLQPELREPALRTLTQSSKRAAVPAEDWIALTGDSYAAGQGDWFRSVDQNRNPPFHSAHLIHRATGRDVVSFGHSGAGSLRALVSEPIAQRAYLAHTWLYGISDPADLLIYFFPGNDLTDNLEHLRKRWDPNHTRAEFDDEVAFQRFIEREVLGESKAWRQAKGFRARENFFLARNLRYGLTRRVRAFLGGDPAELDVAQETVEHERVGTEKAGAWEKARFRNRMYAAGEVVSVGRPLRAPGIVLSDEELELGLEVFRRSARFLADHYPETRIHIVHLPSPAAAYEHETDQVWVFATYFRERDDVFSVRRVMERSDFVCGEVAAFAKAEGFGFVDVRPYARAATEQAVLHGPVDWRHLNRAGHEMLTEAVVDLLEGTAAAQCGRVSRR